jgi:hypothetical protein
VTSDTGQLCGSYESLEGRDLERINVKNGDDKNEDEECRMLTTGIWL